MKNIARKNRMHIRHWSLLLASCALLFFACGSAQRSEGGGYASRSAAYPASEMEGAAGMADSASSSSPGAPYRKEKSDESTADTTPGKDSRMVIYSAEYRMQVESVRETVERVKEMTVRFGGFIESLNTSDSYKYARLVARIPVAKFDEALDAADKLGVVEQKTVSASDVTMQFRDMALRVDTSKKIRDRLYDLLKRAKEPSDKAEILREISRLTTEIDNITTQMNYLKSKSEFSTLSLELKAIVRDTSKVYIASPFAWIASLSPFRRSIIHGHDGDLLYDAPKGFFNYEKTFFRADSSVQDLFVNSDGSVKVRVGLVDNYPKADQKFWNEALLLDFENRKYSIKAKKRYEAKKSIILDSCLITLSGRDVYFVAFGVKEKKIIIIETYGKDEKSFESNRQAIESIITSVGYD